MRLPAQLLRRKLNAHKGDFGHILILAGCPRFSGAAVLCSWAAIRTGAGLVTLGIPEGLNNAIIKIKPPEVMILPLPQTGEGTLSLAGYEKIKDFAAGIDVLVVGPGLSQNKTTQNLVRKIIIKMDKPQVIDADGLNALAGHLDILEVTSQKSEVRRIVTPHPGEMARLLGKRIAAVQAARKEIARSFARDYNCIVILKGHKTLVAEPKGSVYLNRTGNPGMAGAGSGDVLTGMVAALLGQGLNPPAAAKYAVYLHGLAGDLAAKEKTQMGLVASDIIEKIPEAIKKCD